MKAKKKLGFVAHKADHPRSLSLYYCLGIVTVILYLVFEAYGPALRGPFVYDDFSLPFYNPLFRTEVLANWISGVRPLLMLSYWTNFQIAGRDPYWYHVLNLLFHVLNGIAVYLIARRILAGEVLDQKPREILALFASALFLLHPVQTESVAWIAGRSESFSAIFFLYAFALYLYRPMGAIGWGRSALMLLLFACAVASKEHTATLPMVLLLTDYLLAQESPAVTIRKNWRLYAPMLIGGLAAGIFVWKVLSTSTSAGFAGAGVNWLSYALTQCRVFFIYVRLFLLPAGQNIDYDLPWSPVRFDLAAFAGLVGIVALAVIAWRLRRRFPVGSYGFLIFLILLAPTSSIIPIKDPIAERRLYLPMLGLVLVGCEFLMHTLRQRAATIAVASGLLILASVATYRRSQLWGSEAALWEDTVAKSPNKLRGYGHLVHGLIREHHCREAILLLENVSRRIPIDPALLGHWAVAYECVHEPEMAVAKLQLAAAQAPAALTYVNMARNQLELMRSQDAIQSLNRALELDPTTESAYLMRGELYERLGELSVAAHDFQQVLQINPTNEQAQWHLRQIAAYIQHQ